MSDDPRSAPLPPTTSPEVDRGAPPPSGAPAPYGDPLQPAPFPPHIGPQPGGYPGSAAQPGYFPVGPATPPGYQPWPAPANGQSGPGPMPGWYGPGYPAYPPVPPRPGALPTQPAEYHQMLRGPRARWWKPVVALPLLLAIAFPLMLLAALPVLLAAVVAGVPDPLQWTGAQLSTTDLGPGGFFYLLLALAMLIPAAGLSVWIVHGIRPKFLSSVAGGIRWRWLLRCLAISVPLWVVYLGLSLTISAPTGPRPADAAVLLVLAVVVMPFQAAGEEYFFRGWILQNIGSWFRSPVVGLVVGIVLSAALFSAAHLSPDVWVLADLAAFGVTAAILTWRTGGLEAAIALHVVNNVGVSLVGILVGGWQESFVSDATKSTPLAFLVSLAVDLIALSLILWQAKRAGVQRHFRPEPGGVPVPAMSLPSSAGQGPA